MFSRLPDLAARLGRITAYPEAERTSKMESYYSQLPLHFSYMELAEYSQNPYLLAECAVALVLYGGRLILAHNRTLYHGRKLFMRELGRAPEKLMDFLQLAEQLLRSPGIQSATTFLDAIYGYAKLPVPSEGAWQRIHHDSVWNWRLAPSVFPNVDNRPM